MHNTHFEILDNHIKYFRNVSLPKIEKYGLGNLQKQYDFLGVFFVRVCIASTEKEYSFSHISPDFTFQINVENHSFLKWQILFLRIINVNIL